MTWEDHRRSRSLARVLDAELHELTATAGRHRVVRYLRNAIATVRIYRRRHPSTVICQHPSVVLAVLTVLLRPIFGYRVGLDNHNAGFAVDPWFPWYLRRLAVWLQRRADFVIAHNETLKAVVANRGGRLIVVPDPLPGITAGGPALRLSRQFNVLFICGFKPDEPYRAVLEAACTFGPDIGVYVTSDAPDEIKGVTWPDNVVLCGRLPWDRYDQLLRSVNGVMALTTREHCLLCGAHEGVAAGKPLVLSRTAALMGYFSRGVVFTDNSATGSPSSIREAVLELRAREEELCREVILLKDELARRWPRHAQEIRALL